MLIEREEEHLADRKGHKPETAETHGDQRELSNVVEFITAHAERLVERDTRRVYGGLPRDQHVRVLMHLYNGTHAVREKSLAESTGSHLHEQRRE